MHDARRCSACEPFVQYRRDLRLLEEHLSTHSQTASGKLTSLGPGLGLAEMGGQHINSVAARRSNRGESRLPQMQPQLCPQPIWEGELGSC